MKYPLHFLIAVILSVQLLAVDTARSVTYDSATKTVAPSNLTFIAPFTASAPTTGNSIINRDALNNSISTNRTRTVANVSAMQALTGLASGDIVITLGRTTTGDGGGAQFYYSSSSTATTNLGTVFTATGMGSGRLLWSGGTDLDPKMYGAVGNYNSGAGTGADDTLAFQSMITDAFARGVGFRIKTKGTYQLTDSLTIPAGWGGNIDFGGGSLAGYNSEIYMNVTNKPFVWAINSSHFTIQNLSLYFKPDNGWGLNDALSQPQQNTNAFVFKAIGGFTFMDVRNVMAAYGSGFLESYADTAIVPTRPAGATFNNNIENITCRYGLRAIDLDTGSGSTWNNLYLNSSSGGTYTQTAVSALRVRTSIQDESFVRLNVEWSKHTGPSFDLTAADIHFDSMHIEGIRAAYTSSSVKDMFYMAGGKLKFTNCHIRDLYPDWGFLVTLNIFNLASGLTTALSLENCKFESWNEAVGYNFFRYQDNSGGANYIEVVNQDDRDIGWATNSPSWYGPSEKPQLPGKRLEIKQDFEGELIAFETYNHGIPTVPTYVVPAIQASYHPGVLSLYTGVTNFNATLLQNIQTEVFAGGGAIRFKATFMFPTLASTTTDDMIFRIGMFSDVTSGPSNTPTDGVGLEMWRTTYGDNALKLVGRKGGALTSSTLITSANMLANTWYEVEIILNHDGTQARAFLNPRTSSNSANVTSNIPLSTTAIKPMVQLVGRGTTPLTVRQVLLDNLSFTYAPNGVY